MRNPRIMKQFILQSAIWTALCIVTEAICRALHWGFPYDYFATVPESRFGDFISPHVLFAAFHSRAFFKPVNSLMYPAPVYVAYKFFYLFPVLRYPDFYIWRFETFIVAVALVMAALVGRALVQRGLAPLSATLFLLPVFLFSFPLWFEFHQGNMEVMVWLAVTLGVWAFWTGRPWAAAIFFGIAAAMKIYPLVFLALFVARKQYRQALFSVAAIAVTTVVSLWLACPDIAYSWHQTNERVLGFRGQYMVKSDPGGSGFDHSIFGLIKRLVPGMPGSAWADHMLSVYLAIAAIAGLILFFVRLRKLPLVNQVLCLSIAAIAMPPTSFDYTLVHLYAPFALLVFLALSSDVASFSPHTRRGLVLAFVLFAFLLAPQSEFIYHAVRFGGQLKAVALLALVTVGLIFPFPLSSREEIFVPPRESSFEPVMAR